MIPKLLFVEGDGGTTGGSGGASDTGGTSGSNNTDAVVDWRTGLTGDFAPLAKEKTLEQIKGKNWEEAGPLLAKGYHEGQKMIGGMVALPKPDATGKVDDKAVRDLWTKLGVPTDVAGYKDVRLTAIEGLGPVNEKLVESAKPVFLKHGLTPRQGQEMMNLYAAVTSQQRRELAESFVELQAGLEEKWGLNFESNVNLAQRGLRKYFPESFLKTLRDSQLDMHPGMIEGFYELSKHLGEAKFIEGNDPTVEDNTKMEDDIKKLREEMSKMPEGPQLRAANERMEALYKKRYGTGPVGPQR